MTEALFTSPRYMTRGINEKIGLDIQLALWNLIDIKRDQKKPLLDYLQVFDLTITKKNGIAVQKVHHKQEVPFFEQTVYLPPVQQPLHTTIWVMDSGGYCMMLLPQEY